MCILQTGGFSFWSHFFFHVRYEVVCKGECVGFALQLNITLERTISAFLLVKSIQIEELLSDFFLHFNISQIICRSFADVLF